MREPDHGGGRHSTASHASGTRRWACRRVFAGGCLALLACAPFAQAQEEEPLKNPGVRIAFLPPPMEGTLSLGIYDRKGKLVRVLAREATEKEFTIGLNGLITHWDGKDDTGKPAPAGTYAVRGYSVGGVEVEGVALHGNDWIANDDAPRPVRITDVRTSPVADEVEVALQTAEGAALIVPIRFNTKAASPNAKEKAPVIVENRVELTVDGRTRRFPLDDGETAVDATLGTHDRLWVIVQTPTVHEVRAFSLDGEFLRRLSYAPTDPQPRRILAARGTFAERWSEQIVLLEDNEKLQRVRSLALPHKPAGGDTPPWETVLEKVIWRGASFEAVKNLLRRSDGQPFTPEKEFVVRLINNPLLKAEPAAAHVAISFNERGSFLQTTDGLPLRRITETPHLQWTVMGREGSGKLLTILQGDGAVVEEFRVKKLANMMAFDAGDYEWAGK
jgi:hypothetical protein